MIYDNVNQSDWRKTEWYLPVVEIRMILTNY